MSTAPHALFVLRRTNSTYERSYRQVREWNAHPESQKLPLTRAQAAVLQVRGSCCSCSLLPLLNSEVESCSGESLEPKCHNKGFDSRAGLNLRVSRGRKSASSSKPVAAKQPLVHVSVAIYSSQDVCFTRRPTCTLSPTMNLCTWGQKVHAEQSTSAHAIFDVNVFPYFLFSDPFAPLSSCSSLSTRSFSSSLYLVLSLMTAPPSNSTLNLLLFLHFKPPLICLYLSLPYANPTPSPLICSLALIWPSNPCSSLPSLSLSWPSLPKSIPSHLSDSLLPHSPALLTLSTFPPVKLNPVGTKLHKMLQWLKWATRWKKFTSKGLSILCYRTHNYWAGKAAKTTHTGNQWPWKACYFQITSWLVARFHAASY